LFSIVELLAGGLLILALALAAVLSKTIDIPGATLGAVISYGAFLAGGVSWLIIIVIFFAASSILTRYKYNYKRSLGSAQEKGGERSWPNTLANGIIAGVAALAEIATHREIFAVAFIGTIGAAMSDTIATEVGLLSKSKPRSIISLHQSVEPGTSGGISALGESAGFISIVGIVCLSFVLGIVGGTTYQSEMIIVVIILAAFIAMNLDSALGATVQGQYKCRICGTKTENPMHHGVKSITIRGQRLLDNNAINLIATASAALISIALYLLFFHIS
jgi:uncharacterized protein (TIGR00297 family)